MENDSSYNNVQNRQPDNKKHKFRMVVFYLMR